jgi:5'-methylthioadenosine phosphorylase
MASTAGDSETSAPARLAILGGSGVDVGALLSGVRRETASTAYGDVDVEIGAFGPWEVVFLRRHGRGHTVPPQRVNYRANVAALAGLGVTRVLATAAVGSLNPDLGLGTFAVIDNFLDFTQGRSSTFHDGGDEGVVHADVTWPYCPEIRSVVLERGRSADLPVHDGGVYACTQGPRFESAAEVRMLAQLGGDVVGMTGVPEVVLARELGLCYATLAMVTNLAAGLRPEPVTHAEVLDAQRANTDTLARLLDEVVPAVPADRGCGCPARPQRIGG